MTLVQKAAAEDFLGRFREIVSDPLNLLIERVPDAGTIRGGNVVLHNGNIVPTTGVGAYYGIFSDILVINRGVHEPLEEYLFQQLLSILPSAPTMIELGAYWGHYSMWLKKRKVLSTVFLVEPDPTNLQAGRENFVRNKYEGQFIEQFVGKGHFELDTFLNEHSLGRVDIVHADIQGYEMEMLSGASDSLRKRRVDYFFVSTHSDDLHAAVSRTFVEFGYRVEVESNFGEATTSFDGLVFSSSPDIPPAFPDFAALGRSDIVKASPTSLLARLNRLSNGR